MYNINVEVVYALPEHQYIKKVELNNGATVEKAIYISGILLLRKDIDLNINKIGVFSRLVKLNDILKNGDRIEIYRPLINDPREILRQRAKHCYRRK